MPPQSPSYTTVSSYLDLTNYLIYSGLTDISINNQWFLSKTNDFDASFSVNSTNDSDRTVLRLTKIKLDYVGSNSAAFICKDNEGKNIIQNLIPSNFSPQGYSLSLHYNHNGVLKDIGWTLSRSTVSNSQIGDSVNFGGALFDSKNGVITFYDVLGTPSTLEFFSERVTKKFGNKPIALACDHSGYDLKEKTKTILEMKGIEYTDVGTYVDKSCDYYDYVSQAVALIKSNDCDYAISFCRSGQGVNLAANKFDDILSALIFDSYTVEFSIKHNCANHFSIPSKYVDVKTMEEIIDKLITTSFDGGRHFTRLKKFI